VFETMRLSCIVLEFSESFVESRLF